MRSATPELIAFLNSGREFVMADLYTITLRSGVILRYTDADVPITWDAVTFQPLTIGRGATKLQRGVNVDSLDVSIFADENNLINGVPLIPFILAKGFDGGTLRLDRAFGSNWSNLVGTLVWFVGRFGPVTDTSRTQTNLKVNSWLELLNVNMPRNLYQAPCLHTLYDEGCGLDKELFRVDGTIVAGGGNTATSFDTTLSNPDGYFDQGVLVMTEGPDIGVKKTIKRSLATGIITLVTPLTVEPETGWGFSAYPGCDHTQATCLAKFNNLLRFRGFPYIPVPETSV